MGVTNLVPALWNMVAGVGNRSHWRGLSIEAWRRLLSMAFHGYHVDDHHVTVDLRCDWF